MVGFHPGYPTRTIVQVHELEHPLARLPILTNGLQEIGAAQRKQRARLESPHRGVAWFVGE
jgi:hypothetical protein